MVIPYDELDDWIVEVIASFFPKDWIAEDEVLISEKFWKLRGKIDKGALVILFNIDFQDDIKFKLIDTNLNVFENKCKIVDFVECIDQCV